jgi:PAS domain S-box-containing protein
MLEKPTYEELEKRILELEKTVSKFQRQKKALHDQLLHQRTLMEVSLDGIAIIDQNHRVREANDRFAQMLGYTLEEFLGLHTWDFEAILTEAEIRSNFPDLSITKTTFETRHRRKDGTIYDAEVTACGAKLGDESMVLAITRDITERKQSVRQRDKLISDLQKALSEIKTLQGLLPICSHCKKIRNDDGYWDQVEDFIQDHSEAMFSHGICPECISRLYPDMDMDE